MGITRDDASVGLMRVREVLMARDGETAEAAARRVMGNAVLGPEGAQRDEVESRTHDEAEADL